MRTKLFNLDLSECADLPDIGKGMYMVEWPDIIPCRTGRHQMDLDVIESQVKDKAFLVAAKNNAKKPQLNKGTYMKDWPLGFNIRALKVGAKLICIGVEDDG